MTRIEWLVANRLLQIKFEQLFKDWKISVFHSKSDLPFILPTSHNSCLFLCVKMSCVKNSHMVVFMAAVYICLQRLFLTKITLGTLNRHVNTFV